jgi:hypothetical protein
VIPLFDAPPAPRGLLFLATFSKRERAEMPLRLDSRPPRGLARRPNGRRSCASTAKIE